MTLTADIQLQDIIDSSSNPSTLKLNVMPVRIEITLPDGQVVGIEQSFGQIRFLNWMNEDDDNPIVIPLTSSNYENNLRSVA